MGIQTPQPKGGSRTVKGSSTWETRSEKIEDMTPEKARYGFDPQTVRHKYRQDPNFAMCSLCGWEQRSLHHVLSDREAAREGFGQVDYPDLTARQKDAYRGLSETSEAAREAMYAVMGSQYDEDALLRTLERVLPRVRAIVGYSGLPSNGVPEDIALRVAALTTPRARP
jgi:hypothetical protein